MVSHDNVGFYLLSQEVSKFVKVVQSGQGADEIFGGYHWYPPMLDTQDALATYKQHFFDRNFEDYQRMVGPGLFNALLAISVVNIPFFARTVRGATVLLRSRQFVEASRVCGRPETGILFRQILPNVVPVILITSAATLGWMILETAGLSFLGLGAQPPRADLGAMLGEGRKLMLIAPHLALLPGTVVFVLVMGINLFADGLRDVLDPRTTRN